MLCNILGSGNAMMKLPGISHFQKSLSIRIDVKAQPKLKSTAFACPSHCLASVFLHVSSKFLNSHARPVRSLGSSSQVCAILRCLNLMPMQVSTVSGGDRKNKKHCGEEQDTVRGQRRVVQVTEVELYSC